jgi:hypothetical protein
MRIRILGGLMALLFVGALNAEGFWTTDELADQEFSELDGVIKLRFKDAVTAAPIKDLTLEVAGQQFISDHEGVINVPSELYENVTDKDLPFTASARGYINLEDTLQVRVGTIITTRFVLSPGMPANQARIVLEWGDKPRDLDSWLTGPDFTVSYRSKINSDGKAQLDQDSTMGYGPETITLLDIAPGATYEYAVKNYSRDAPIKNAKISVYVNNRLDRVLWIPAIKQNEISVLKIVNKKVIYLIQ